MTDPVPADLPLSELAPEEKAKLAGSFGQVASRYERYRPGPPAVAVDWLLPTHVRRVVDLGAGTGALTRLLVDRADAVVAVEPDDGMRGVLTAAVAGVEALPGRGESIPIPDDSVDAVLASSSWHWMDPVPTLHEVGRILVSAGILGVVWSGPDPDGAFIVQARELLTSSDDEFSNSVLGAAGRRRSTLEIPDGVPFDQPDHGVFRWDVALDADELVGMLGTFSWVITMPDDQRERTFAEARRLLRELLGVEGDVTVDVAFRADAWRARRHDRSDAGSG